MSINYKKFRFSNYVDQNEIIIKDIESKLLRFSLLVPYKNREDGPVATVIMYNPSKAGQKDDSGEFISDFTVYNILQYLYHHENNFQMVRILNLFPLYSTKPNNLLISNHALKLNRAFLKCSINKVKFNTGDKLICAWGEPTKDERTIYKNEISYLKEVIGKMPVYHVENLKRTVSSPQHGSMWLDYEELKRYKIK